MKKDNQTINILSSCMQSLTLLSRTNIMRLAWQPDICTSSMITDTGNSLSVLNKTHKSLQHLYYMQIIDVFLIVATLADQLVRTYVRGLSRK